MSQICVFQECKLKTGVLLKFFRRAQRSLVNISNIVRPKHAQCLRVSYSVRKFGPKEIFFCFMSGNSVRILNSDDHDLLRTRGVFLVNNSQVYYFIVLCVFSDTFKRWHCAFLAS